MNASLILLCALAYLVALFLIAYYGDRRATQGRSLINNPYTYSLSLAVYCTAWTFYGSVGRATETGLSFLTVYLGPTILAPLWVVVLRKMILITKAQRITSIADFISSRYGKSTTLGVIATTIAVLGVTPYISIQLKAIATSFDIMAPGLLPHQSEQAFYLDSPLYVAIILGVFTILFGTRHLDPNRRHEGLVAAVAFESLVKLFAFLAVGIFVTFGMYQGLEDLFQQAMQREDVLRLFSLEESGFDGTSWGLSLLLSMLAIILLPRQFHLAVVENTNPDFVQKASWLLPLYLLLINIFVLPIALGGMLQFPLGEVESDMFVLHLPLLENKAVLALLVFIGGLSAATSMVIVAVIALSIMISNNLVLPLLLRATVINEQSVADLYPRLLGIRRVSIALVLLLAYAYFKSVGPEYSLVSIGLISFTAVAQFAPVIIGGIYWKRATRAGAISALLVGFVVWAFTLPLPTMAEAGSLSRDFIDRGFFQLAFLKPYALFGMEGMDRISHAAFWSLLLNTATYFTVSLYTEARPQEVTQAVLFVDVEKYQEGNRDLDMIKREAKVADIMVLLNRFLGEQRASELLRSFERQRGQLLAKSPRASDELIDYAEKHLAGAIGAASAKIIITSIAKESPISLGEIFNLLDQTQEIIQYSKALEKKSTELERTTRQLQTANAQLQELDRLKADFITTVTHELRTPITSIKALSRILLDNPDLPEDKQREFGRLIVNESERITRLINQVLDLKKLQAEEGRWAREPLDLGALVRQAFAGMEKLFEDHHIAATCRVTAELPLIVGDGDRLTQVVVNLLSNALKFCASPNGVVGVDLKRGDGGLWLEVSDNGRGIEARDQALIFERFT
ncbi:MAG: sensor histidine kinase, partial [Bacteroidota bacterium]